MKEKLNELADRLVNATSSDAPRGTMKSVADELRALAGRIEDNTSVRSHALELAEMIQHHQYGLRGFGDGSLQRGRDLSQREQQTITTALRAYGTVHVALPAPMYYHVPGPNEGHLWKTSFMPLPAGAVGLYTTEQAEALLK